MDLIERENALTRRRRLGIVASAIACVAVGALAGFLAKAAEPVKEFAMLPPQTGKEANPLPRVFWLRRHSAPGIGAPREKEAAVKDGRPVALTDREIGVWLNRTFATDDVPKEDLDAVAGVAFVRVGGQLPGTENDPVLTVTMPFKTKFFSLPVADVNLQFVARPLRAGGDTLWAFENVRLGHARIPDFMAADLVPDVVRRYLKTSEAGEKMTRSLAAYRQVAIRDGKLFLAGARPAGR